MFKKILRKTVSLTALFCFIILASSGIVLSFTPPGRLANWSYWKVFGLMKEEYTAVHTTVSYMFVILMILHIWLNWKSIWLYLKNKKTGVSAEFAVSLVIALAFLFGTLSNVTPFKNFLNALSDYKEHYEDTIVNPPFGHAELAPLDGLIAKMGFDFDKSMELLEKEGIKVSNPSGTLKTIAGENKISPSDIYEIIKNTKKEDGGSGNIAPAEQTETITGVGKMSVATLAGKAGISTEKALELLKAKGIEASEDDRIKDIAENSGMMPTDFYDYFKAAK
jgi:hypothetical protein